jgi:ergothioneine biosynthesis protein EgtB
MPSDQQADTVSIESLLSDFNASRLYSTRLVEPLSPEDCQAQSMDDASPAKWHLAHVTWFYEVMILKPYEKNFKFWNPQFAVLFNSYYNGVGDKHPRTQRGLLTRPTLAEVIEWRADIDARMNALLKTNDTTELQWLVRLGINHEQQHQELLLTDIQHLFAHNSLLPRYFLTDKPSTALLEEFKWIDGHSGLVEIGHQSDEFYFDNEGPRHTAFNAAHALGSTLVTNAEWLLFIKDKGYQNARWWLDAGWAWVKAQNISAPLYWTPQQDGSYSHFSLYGQGPLVPQAAVTHMSYFEADAFARWASENIDQYAGARLPTEFEWEAFAAQQSATDLFGKVWQWTSSHYSPYPGYKPWGGVAGEYNGKFMVNQMVLRGSSAFTSAGHSRNSYRNFFPTHARWQLTGLRLARD